MNYFAVLATACLLTAVAVMGAGPRTAFASNDLFANSQTLTDNDGVTTPVIAHATTADATMEAGEPAPCGALGATVWFNWTSPAAAATVTFDTFGSNYDTVLAIYTGSSVEALTPVPGTTCNDDHFVTSNRQSVVSFTTEASTTYRIQVGGFSGATGNAVLNYVSAADLFVGTAANYNSPDGVLSLREALMIANGSLACANLDSLEALAAVNCAGGENEMIHFLPSAFPAGLPATINVLAGEGALPPLSSGGDVVTGLGAGVIIDGETRSSNCLTITSAGNYIGGLDIRRCLRGIDVDGGVSNVIGVQNGPSPLLSERNIIRENATGIRIANANGPNRVRGNYIGTNQGGASGLGNLEHGVLVENASLTEIGATSPGHANVIRGNGGAGVSVVSGAGNAIIGNSVIGNMGLGIDLGAGSTASPQLSSATVGASTTTVSGMVNSTPNEALTVQFFHSNTCDASGNGEGEVHLGDVAVVTGPGGTVSFTPSFQGAVAAGRFITATATGTADGTSEFSNCVASVDDADDDNDGYGDVNESGAPLCAGSVNNDAFDDAVANDGCAGGPAQAGSFSEAEFRIGTSHQDPCGNNGWPNDLVEGGPQPNRLNLLDLTSFVAPVRRLGTNPGTTGFDSRWDLSPGGTPTFINILDVTALTPGNQNTTARPPMLGGTPAFGETCPFAP